MKTIEEFLSEFRRLDIKLWVEGDRLRFRAPSGALSPTLRSQLAERKAEVLEFLRKANAATSSNLPPLLPISREGNLPLSFAQERLWFLEQLESGSSVYNLALAFRITGLLNQEAMKNSLLEIARRHEILRTVFPAIDGQPVQVISPIALTMPVVNLRLIPPQGRESEAQRLATQEAQQPFDLAQGPLWRVKLLCLGEEEHWFLLTMHHIVSDGWSLTALLREISALYKAFCNNEPSPLPELSVQYADFASWQRQWLQGEVVASGLSYWQQHLSGNVPTLQLPTQRSQLTIQTYQGARQSLVLPKLLVDVLNSISQQADATLFMTLLAAFQTLLYQYTGQEDIVLCSPVAGRNQSETEGLIGYFNNILPLRTKLDGNPSFRDLLARVRLVAKDAYEHQDVPLQKIAELPNLIRTPLTRGMFALQNAPSQALSLAGTTVSSLDIHNGTANFDLSLFLEEKEDTVTAFLDYKTDLFDADTITQMLGNYQTLLETIAANPELHLEELPKFTTGQNLHWADNNPSNNLNPAQKSIYIAPRDELEIRLVKIWEKVLDLEPIGIQDNFFSDLGGSSLLAAKLFDEIEKAFNQNLPLATLLQSPTIEQQANLLRQEKEAGSWSSLVPIQTGGVKPPLFCIHAVGGNILTYVDLARYLGSDQPVYGLQAQGIDGKAAFHTSIEEMAAHYIKAIQVLQPEGPYFLGGLSGGGIIAFEMAQQLVAQGHKVAMLALFDSYNPDYLRARCIADHKYRTEQFSVTKSILERWKWYWNLQVQLLRVARVGRQFLQLEPQEKLSYFIEKFKRLKERSKYWIELISYKLDRRPGRLLPYLLRESAASKALSQAVFNYIPKAYPGKVTLFRANATIFYSSDGLDNDELGWDEVADGGLEIHKVPGEHNTLLAEPHIRVVAPILKSCLDKILADEADGALEQSRKELRSHSLV